MENEMSQPERDAIAEAGQQGDAAYAAAQVRK